MGALFLIFSAGMGTINKINSPTAFKGYLLQAFGYHDSRAQENLEPSYNYLRSQVGSKDVIIVTTVEYGLFFLGRDYDYYYLRQKKANNAQSAQFVQFDEDREPYYGKPLIDSVEKFLHLMRSSENPIWVVADYKTDYSVGPEIKKMISEEFELMFDDYQRNRTRVYRRV